MALLFVTSLFVTSLFVTSLLLAVWGFVARSLPTPTLDGVNARGQRRR